MKTISRTKNEEIFTAIALLIVLAKCAIGRSVADALEAHQVEYAAVDRHFDRFTTALVDGYPVQFGDLSDLRLAQTMSVDKRASIVLADVRLDKVRSLMPIVHERYPHLTRFISVDDESLVAEFQELGMTPIVNETDVPGLAMAEQVMRSHDIDEQKITSWIERRKTESMPVTI